MKKLVSIVVPVFNNKETLSLVNEKIIKLFEGHFSTLCVEIVFVDDGSTDDSWHELQRLASLQPQIVKPISLSRNFGQLGALHAGFSVANGSALICISADMQDPIDLMQPMLKQWLSGADIVIAYRQDRKDGIFNKISSHVAYAFARKAYPKLPKGGFDYWLMTSEVNNLLVNTKGRHNFLQGYLTSLGFETVILPYVRQQRPHGKSGYKFGKKLKIFIDFVIDTSDIPIRCVTLFGAAAALLGVVYSAIITVGWFYSMTPFDGWAPLMILNLILGGSIIFILGLLGEYIWRIYDNIRDFPLYIIDKRKSALTEANDTKKIK